MRKGELKRAAEVLETVTGTVDVQGKIDEITGTIDTERSESLRDLRGNRLGLKPIVWIGILLSVFQQFVGINVIFYYSTTLWQSVGFDESSALLTSVITSVTNIVVTIVAILLVDKIGRRIMLLVGSVGMTVTLGLMAVAFSFGTLDAQGTATLPDPWATIALVLRERIRRVLRRELGPARVGSARRDLPEPRSEPAPSRWPAAAQWVANFFISTTFPAFAEIGLTFAYGFYAFFALLSFFFVFFKVPETKGKELEEMTENMKVQRRRGPPADVGLKHDRVRTASRQPWKCCGPKRPTNSRSSSRSACSEARIRGSHGGAPERRTSSSSTFFAPTNQCE